MLIFFLIIIIGIIGFYLFKNSKVTKSSSTFANTSPKKDIIIQNATKNSFYIKAFTIENKVSDVKYIAPGMPATTSNKKSINICPKTELKSQTFVKISGIIDTNLQLLIYYNNKIIKNYTYSDLYNVGKANDINNLGLNISILDNTGKIGMYNLGIKK